MSTEAQMKHAAVGLTLQLYINDGVILKDVARRLCQAEALRCLSPYRSALCDRPAGMILWQDIEEWYPCCAAHADTGPFWTGSTRFCAPRHIDFEVIPAPAFAWLESLTEDERDRLKPKCEIYKREEG